MKSKTILVTGAAGFIGFHLCLQLLNRNFKVIGFDNINDYYDTELKNSRINKIKELKNNNWRFKKGDLQDYEYLNSIFVTYKPQIVVNLAAQAGVRYSLQNPVAYINSNLVGFGNVLECCRIYEVENLIYASSSSVYGGNGKYPFSENDSVDHPVSLYAATKKSNELMAHAYSHIYKLPTTGLRFFTVYGAWGRPDMAPMIFTKSILEQNPIKIFNYGEMYRDFTYIDDVISIVCHLIDLPAEPNINFDKKLPEPSSSWAPYKIYNIGNNNPIPLMQFIETLEDELGLKAKKEFVEMQKGDVFKTAADTKIIKSVVNYSNTSLQEGIHHFVTWYKNFYF